MLLSVTSTFLRDFLCMYTLYSQQVLFFKCYIRFKMVAVDGHTLITFEAWVNDFHSLL